VKTITTLVAIVAVLALGLYLYCIYRLKLANPPGYVAFTLYRSKKYYSELANACDDLIAKAQTNTSSDLLLRGDDPRLPVLLQNLKATSVDVTTNQVLIWFRIHGRYSVDWEPDYANSNAWVLTAHGEAEPPRLFIRTNGIQNSFPDRH
jgi:hypothetical protein